MDAVPQGTRIRLAHHRIFVEGQQVGITVGGVGPPLVFFHGIALNRLTYTRVLSRLPHLGFRVVAIDAPGHGHTGRLALGNNDFRARIEFTAKILDALEIERALLVGHSMGGRTALEVAALQPDRAAGVVLVDAAAGADFDRARDAVRSAPRFTAELSRAIVDTLIHPFGLDIGERLRYFRTLAAAVGPGLTNPGAFAAAATAIGNATPSAAALAMLRAEAVPVSVIHGERDMVVSMASAEDAAAAAAATLTTIPHAHHSWVLSHPWVLSLVLSTLLEDEHFGDAVSSRLASYRASEHRGGRLDILAPPVTVVGPVGNWGWVGLGAPTFHTQQAVDCH